VSVEGVATTDTGFPDPGNGRFYLDEGTGGVQIREKVGVATPVARGDLVWVGGFVSQVLGETMLVDASVERRGSGGEAGPVRSVATGELGFPLEPWEGRVVEVVGANVTAGTWPVGGAPGQVTVDDGSGPSTLLIPSGVVIPSEASDLSDFRFTALITQGDFSRPYTTRYSFTLRTTADLLDPGSRALSAPDAALRLGIPRPNPFRVSLTVPVSSPEPTLLEVLDVAGRRVRRLDVPAGAGQVQWDGRDADGRNVASGVYWLRLGGAAEAPLRVVKLR
jgi:hypothetical protein